MKALTAILLSALVQVSQSLHLIMTADNGAYSGVSEGKYIYDAMTNRVNVSDKAIDCQEVTEGQLYGVPVTLVTTGIGHDNAAGCTVAMVGLYGKSITGAMYLGTSGWSPRVGGFFNPEVDKSCQTYNNDSQIIGIGDVCVSTSSFLYNCGFCSWPDKTNGQCAYPSCTDHTESTVFSQCDFTSQNYALENGLMAASKLVTFPERSANLTAYLNAYWEATWSGLGVALGPKPSSVPQAYDHTACGEAASYDLWKGVPQDYQCRKYLSRIAGTTPDKVACVSAMEGPGWMRVLLKHQIPYVGLRSASNYDYWPVFRQSGTLQTNNNWVKQGSLEDFTKKGYAYAIQTVSMVVLQYFKSL
eukprot:TRINITY_DN204_c0_g1_i1.p1 TRINITY_DN204_c0_g1~~TRINITY_DN204_c0_g1_i1.p1  ORF type:complete len:377 (+),score=49.47 TRINITY_DN204_c0_g1_i1:58-1131(+)